MATEKTDGLRLDVVVNEAARATGASSTEPELAQVPDSQTAAARRVVNGYLRAIYGPKYLTTIKEGRRHTPPGQQGWGSSVSYDLRGGGSVSIGHMVRRGSDGRAVDEVRTYVWDANYKIVPGSDARLSLSVANGATALAHPPVTEDGGGALQVLRAGLRRRRTGQAPRRPAASA